MRETILEDKEIQSMFGRIAPRYDLLNHVLSLGLDFHWWGRMAKACGAGRGCLVLDVAAGTCDSALALARRGHSVVACDFCVPMLTLGRGKIKKSRAAWATPDPIGADARRLPFRDAAFDALTICFGLRNIDGRGRAYSEFIRVLKPGGKLVVLEFSRPRWAWLRFLYGLYSRFLVPAVGRLLSGDGSAYSYLPESIGRFPAQAGLADELIGAGFSSVAWRDLGFGVAAIHTAAAPARRPGFIS